MGKKDTKKKQLEGQKSKLVSRLEKIEEAIRAEGGPGAGSMSLQGSKWDKQEIESQIHRLNDRISKIGDKGAMKKKRTKKRPTKKRRKKTKKKKKTKRRRKKTKKR